jgi:Mg2+ and Co2+ transporter CorA
MAEDAGVEQARMLVGLLRDEIAEISDKLKAPDSDVHRRTEHGHHRRVRRAALLRRQFYEAHRLLDGLYKAVAEFAHRGWIRRDAKTVWICDSERLTHRAK